MLNRIYLLLAGVFFFFSFIIFSYLVHKDVFKQFDFNATVKSQDNISIRFDDVFSILSEVGKFEIMLIALVLIFVLARKWLAGFVAFVLFGGFHVIELFGKTLVDHLPPPEFLLRTKHLVDFPQFHVRTEFSYPSGHAGRTMFISVILIVLILQNKRLPLWGKAILLSIIFGYDIAMFVSRVYLGEHWATDVIGGGMLGLAFGLLTATLLVEKTKPAKANS